MTRSCFPNRSPFYGVVVGWNSSNVNFKGGGGQPTLQPLLQEGQHGSDRTSSGGPHGERNTIRRTGSTSAHRPVLWTVLVLEAIVRATSWGRSPRTLRVPSRDHTMEFSQVLDAGAGGCPVSEKANPFLRGIGQGGAVARSMSSGKPSPAGPIWSY